MSGWVVGLGETVGLAAVVLGGYFFGRRARTEKTRDAVEEKEREIERASQIARELEKITESLRQGLANHHAQVVQFKRKLRKLPQLPSDESWQLLCHEAESVLVPTLELASQLSQAYDQLRQQSQALATFTAGRVDPLTGVATAQALEEQIAFYLRCQQSNRNSFSLAMLTVDSAAHCGRSRQEIDRTLQNVAHLLQRSVRGHDFLARYGTEEFGVLLPLTKLPGANQFAQRIRRLLQEQLDLTVSVGLAESTLEDNAKTLLGRADSALYSARATGGDCQFSHTGAAIRPQSAILGSPASSPGTDEEPPAAAPAEHVSAAEISESLDRVTQALAEAST